MAEKVSWSRRAGVTPGKLRLIGALAFVMVAVLYLQFGRPAPENPPAAASEGAERRPRRSGRAASLAAKASPDQSRAAARKRADSAPWPTPDLQAVIRYDPFALPAAFPQPKPKVVATSPIEQNGGELPDPEEQKKNLANALQQTELELERMRLQGVQVIVTQQDQYVALIGGNTVRVGDEINGFKVIAIDPSGVKVERSVQQ